MKIQEKIRIDLKQSIINGNTVKKNLLRTVIGEFNRVGKDISEDKSISIIKKMKNNAKEMNNSEELFILSEYLPEIMGEEKTKKIILDIIKEKNYSMKDIGIIMKKLKNKYGQLIDMKIASKFVKEFIS